MAWNFYDSNGNLLQSSAIADDSIVLAYMSANSVDSDQYVDGSIDTAHIADNQVTLAKMAGGTDGQVITYDASGDPVAVGPGTDGQVLTSTGAGSPPAFEAAAGNVAFPATQVASGDANTLDDYEEGDFTPGIADDSLDGSGESQTYSRQVGRYTKIGNRVFFSLYIVMTSIGTLTTTHRTRITGLPFPTIDVANRAGMTYTGYAAALAITAGNYVAGTTSRNSAVIDLRIWDDADGTSDFTVANLSADGALEIDGNYEV